MPKRKKKKKTNSIAEYYLTCSGNIDFDSGLQQYFRWSCNLFFSIFQTNLVSVSCADSGESNEFFSYVFVTFCFFLKGRYSLEAK